MHRDTKQYQALLFDLDDTLWDTYNNHRRSLKQLFDEQHWNIYYPTFEEYFAVYFPHQEQLWADLRKGYISKEQLLVDRLRYPLRAYVNQTDEEWLKINRHFFMIVGSQTDAIPHAIEVLQALHPHYTICIVSNGFLESQQMKMDGAGLTPYIDEVVLIDHAGTPKPNAAFFDYTCRLIGIPPERCLVIGDSWDSDIVGAFNYDLDAVWYNRWQAPMPSYDTDRHSVCEISDLRELLPRLLS